MILTNLISRLFTRPADPPPGGLDETLEKGYRLQQAGAATDAERAYREALALRPDNPDANYLLGALLGERGEVDAAGAHLERALAANPHHAHAHAARGNLYLMRKEYDRAIASYERALAVDPDNATAHSNLGLAAQATGKPAIAKDHFLRAYALAPQIPDLLKNLTLSYLEFEQFDEAERWLREILARMPGNFEALRCLGLVLQKTHRPDEALSYYERAGAPGAVDPEFLNNFGIVLQDLGRLDEAIAKYDAALALKPDFTLAIWHRSLARLLRHDFTGGWPDYELRNLSADIPARPADIPRWNAEPLAGKTLLVYAEQGLGDEIMFASCLPDVLCTGAKLVVECSPKLEPLFRRSFQPALLYPVAEDRAIPGNVAASGIDLQIPIGSLPLHFRREIAAFPAHRGYLKADPARVNAWRQRLAALGAGLKVGIAWQGGTRRSRQPVRSLPLERLQPLLMTRGCQFVDLQYTDCTAEIADLKASTAVTVHSWPEIRREYEDTAALVAALDLVVSVCTAVIHLGGALGKPVWVMAPFSPEWRYGFDTAGMPWYPSVRVFRQPAYGQWDAVIAEVARALQERARERPAN